MVNVPVTRTTFTTQDYSRAVLRAWKVLCGVLPTKPAVGCLWAQYALETGRGVFCWNNNIGNVKHTTGHDYMMLRGTWEIVNGKRVVFEPPHPATWFNAYTSLDDAMQEHLRLLKERRYASAWPAITAGDAGQFAAKLREKGYYTAPLEDYSRGLRAYLAEYTRMVAYEGALAEVLESMECETGPELPSSSATLPTTYADAPATVHVSPHLYRLDEEPPDDDAA